MSQVVQMVMDGMEEAFAYEASESKSKGSP